MSEKPPNKEFSLLPSLDLTEEDIYEAMKLIPGYLDITPGDFAHAGIPSFGFKAVRKGERGYLAKSPSVDGAG